MGDNTAILRGAVRKLLSAMQQAVDEGCADHFDCCDDAGEFWDGAIRNAEAVLVATEESDGG